MDLSVKKKSSFDIDSLMKEDSPVRSQNSPHPIRQVLIADLNENQPSGQQTAPAGASHPQGKYNCTGHI